MISLVWLVGCHTKKEKEITNAVPNTGEISQNQIIKKIAQLKERGYEIVDYHGHLKGGLTMEQLLEHSKETGIEYGVAFNAGIGFPITNDSSLEATLNQYKEHPVYKAMQAEGREWTNTFSKEKIDMFDYVFTDAMTWTDSKGRRLRLWIKDEVFVDDKEDFMDQLVGHIVDIMENEPIDIYVNSTFVPEILQDEYDELWTEERMDKVIQAAVNNNIAMEINARYKIPSAKFIKKAKAAGVKFSMGTNNPDNELGYLEYPIRMIEECGLQPGDFFKPRKK